MTFANKAKPRQPTHSSVGSDHRRPCFSSVARVIMGKQSIKRYSDYFGLGEGSTLPVGVPVPWPSSRPPEGWLAVQRCRIHVQNTQNWRWPTRPQATRFAREFIRGWDDLRMIDGDACCYPQEATYICTAIQAYHGVAGGADIQAGFHFASR